MNFFRSSNPALKLFAAALVILCAAVFLRSKTGM